MLRILAIAHLFPNVAERRYGIFVARQLSAMVAEGAEITVLVPRLYCPGWLRFLLGKPASYDHKLALAEVTGVTAIAIPYVGLPGQWFNRWSGLSAYFAMRSKASQLHAQQRFEVIYASELFLSGDSARRLSSQIGIPAACLAIGSDINVTAKSAPLLRKHFKRIVSELDGNLACGAGAAEELQEQQPKRNTLCVYGVVDLGRFSPADDPQQSRSRFNLPKDKTLILYVGYLWKRKGLLELIEAFRLVRAQNPGSVLVICGGGNEEETIKAAADASPVRDAIHFTGNIDPEEIHHVFRACDVFVLPSHAEGMPNALMEAMACGLPVVCTSVGGIPAALGDNEGAIQIRPKDSSELATALNSVVSNEDQRKRMRAAARQLAVEEFGDRRNARKILEYLTSMVDLNE